MERAQILDLLMLLSALESWAFSNKTMLPDYLQEMLCKQGEMLSELLLDSVYNK